jgi:hypothetical protein
MKKHLAQICSQLDTGIGKINQREAKIISRTLISPEQPTLSRAERQVIERTLISGETKKIK